MFGNKVSDENAPVVRTYALDEPVYFTSYKGTADSGVTRKYLTIDGRGCTIAVRMIL
ncbi:MAG: hypothetical protein IKW08_05775 [Roseburia sp.]|nr:hypothetical protein [Roseburia sp.]